MRPHARAIRRRDQDFRWRAPAKATQLFYHIADGSQEVFPIRDLTHTEPQWRGGILAGRDPFRTVVARKRAPSQCEHRGRCPSPSASRASEGEVRGARGTLARKPARFQGATPSVPLCSLCVKNLSTCLPHTETQRHRGCFRFWEYWSPGVLDCFSAFNGYQPVSTAFFCLTQRTQSSQRLLHTVKFLCVLRALCFLCVKKLFTFFNLASIVPLCPLRPLRLNRLADFARDTIQTPPTVKHKEPLK